MTEAQSVIVQDTTIPRTNVCQTCASHW